MSTLIGLTDDYNYLFNGIFLILQLFFYRFKWGKKVLINFGKPIEMKDVMEHARNIRADDVMTRKLITDKIQEEMMILKDQTERMYAKLKSS